jgi:alpha-glucosidase
MRIILLLVLNWISFTLTAQQSYQLFSPDSLLKLEVDINDKLSWHLYAENKLLTQSSSIDLQIAGQKSLSDKLSVASHKYSAIRENILVPVPYRKKNLTNHFNQLEIIFRNYFRIQLRMYNEGMAYRIGIKYKDSINIENETAIFELDDSANVWFSHINKRPDADRFHTSFEGVYSKQSISAIPDTMLTYAPVTVALSNGYYISICDANLSDYPGMFLQKKGNSLQGIFAGTPAKETLTGGEFPQYVVTERANYIARTNGTRMLPWRAVLVARRDIDLPTNNLTYLLGDKSQLTDISWIKYGKGTDEWITGINLFNVPFVAGINTASYKYYIDFAKRFGLDQVMLDAGWSDVKDLFKITPTINMDELSAYAKGRNIRLMLWTLSATLERQLDSALKQFNKWGIASIMTDFIDRDDQKSVNFYHRIAKACADHKISIMFHGAFPPKGFNRTWPNVLTHEGVLGSEWNIWSELPTPDHNVAIAFTRMLAGPLDYEPGLLQNAQKDQFRPIGKNPMSIGTRCHQLAMFVVYDSPLQIFSGNISQGIKEPEFMELLGSISTTWDDTQILDGKIGGFIVTARKKDNDWFIAGLNNSIAKTISLNFNFIGSNEFDLTFCRDGVNANNYGSDYAIEKSTIKYQDELSITMASGGGFLIRLKKKK